jgi:hypothetical protein
MKSIGGTGSVGWIYLFLTGLLSLLFSPFAAHTQSTSTPFKLEGTQWQGKSISQSNVDGSITVLTTTYTFEKLGKATLLIFISKGIGITTTGTPFGSIPFSSARTLSGTYRFSGNSLYIDFPDRAIEATVSGDGMKGMLTAKANNQRENWIAAKVSGQSSSPVPTATPKATQPVVEIEPARKEKIVKSLMEGRDLYRIGKYREAIPKFDEAVGLSSGIPNHFWVYEDRGMARVKVGDYKGALEDFDRCAQNAACKDSASLYEGRGSAKLGSKDFRGALIDYNKFFQLFDKPKDSSPGGGVDVADLKIFRDQRKSKVYKDRGTAKYKLGDKAGACEDYRQSCRLSSDGGNSACNMEKVVCN